MASVLALIACNVPVTRASSLHAEAGVHGREQWLGGSGLFDADERALPAVVSVSLIALAGMLMLRAFRRWELSRAKHRSLTGHSNMSRTIARLVPFFSYGEQRFFSCDAAPTSVAGARRAGFFRLAESFADGAQESRALHQRLEPHFSDLQFTSRYRVPFPFSALVRQHLSLCVFVTRSRGVMVEDVDGRSYHDVTGSYGVNLLGYEFYKGTMERAWQRTKELGPVLGNYHPVIVDNVERLCRISGMDEVSFHMSGTEAVMQAVRLARYHTGRSHIVRFCGAYHGWNGEVQPGIGNPQPAEKTYTLADMIDRSLRVLATRNDIACVLVNPLQAMHPNRNAPSDSVLVGSGRTAHFDAPAYARWLASIREVCTRRGIVLIFDEIFVGFRIAPEGAQAYFGVAADMVTYGKTLGGGLPVGVVCGKAELMRRFREDRPTDICFARGTFNSHPLVMAAMNEFLRALDEPSLRLRLKNQEELWRARARRLNADLEHADLPVRVVAMASIWTIRYLEPSRYNWMFQYYLRAAGLLSSWVGSGRLIFSADYDDNEFACVERKFIAAARAMQSDQWWWHPQGQTHRQLTRGFARELVQNGYANSALGRMLGRSAERPSIPAE